MEFSQLHRTYGVAMTGTLGVIEFAIVNQHFPSTSTCTPVHLLTVMFVSLLTTYYVIKRYLTP
ncbi:hypothetical protein GGR58DRAFT_470609 [Xylaria digitata]|nr:hypothetical protein GGR58DRAFT_470609 [Xylaria digitata]